MGAEAHDELLSDQILLVRLVSLTKQVVQTMRAHPEFSMRGFLKTPAARKRSRVARADYSQDMVMSSDGEECVFGLDTRF
jgi:hypothetical protein